MSLFNSYDIYCVALYILNIAEHYLSTLYGSCLYLFYVLLTLVLTLCFGYAEYCGASHICYILLISLREKNTLFTISLFSEFNTYIDE